MINHAFIEVIGDACQNIQDQHQTLRTHGQCSFRTEPEKIHISPLAKGLYQLGQNDFEPFQLHTINENHEFEHLTLHIHQVIYQQSKNIQCVMYVHTNATLFFSQLQNVDNVVLQHIKAPLLTTRLPTTQGSLSIPIISSQSTPIRENIVSKWAELEASQCFLLQNDGLFCWGNTIFEVEQRLDKILFLLACDIAARQAV